jgi:hypothetical protein
MVLHFTQQDGGLGGRRHRGTISVGLRWLDVDYRSEIMKAVACLAVLALAIAGCSIHDDTVVQKPVPTTTAYVVAAPTTTVLVPVN